MKNPTREEIEKTYRRMKKQIMDSNVLLSPEWSSIDENVLDYVIERAIDITFKRGDDDLNKEETKIMKIFMTLVNKSITHLMNNNEEVTNKIYDSFIAGEMDELSEDYKKYIGKKLKDGLISHEQYEKIKGVEDKIK